ncbi:MAG: VIT1/CCC1 transporter family protein [Alphaproteobacteria bacterium]
MHSRTPHIEKHFTGSATVRDVVIGMADGLTVPFALAAGLSAAINSTDIIVAAGLAEIAAGCIAMGLGGYLAAKTDVEHYKAEEKREYDEIIHLREREVQEVRDVFTAYGLQGAELETVTNAIIADDKRWVDFMMRFELGMEEPDPKRAPVSAATIGGAYVVGGLIPLAPYIVQGDIQVALGWSIVLTAIALVVFGGVKGYFTGLNMAKSAAQTLLVGGLAAATAYYVASFFGG